MLLLFAIHCLNAHLPIGNNTIILCGGLNVVDADSLYRRLLCVWLHNVNRRFTFKVHSIHRHSVRTSYTHTKQHSNKSGKRFFVSANLCCLPRVFNFFFSSFIFSMFIVSWFRWMAGWLAGFGWFCWLVDCLNSGIEWMCFLCHFLLLLLTHSHTLNLLIITCISIVCEFLFFIHFPLLFLVSMWSNNVFSVHNMNLSFHEPTMVFFFILPNSEP